MAAISRFGGVDILISNAGAAQTGFLPELNDQQLAAAYDPEFLLTLPLCPRCCALPVPAGTGRPAVVQYQ